jgi:hypothetical protein
MPFYQCLPTSAYQDRFSFVFPFFGHLIFPLIYGIGILVADSRILLHVHTWFDIGGGVAMAGLSYRIAGKLLGTVTPLDSSERGTQMMQIMAGIILSLLITIIDVETLVLAVLVITWAGMALLHLARIFPSLWCGRIDNATLGKSTLLCAGYLIYYRIVADKSFCSHLRNPYRIGERCPWRLCECLRWKTPSSRECTASRGGIARVSFFCNLYILHYSPAGHNSCSSGGHRSPITS